MKRKILTLVLLGIVASMGAADFSAENAQGVTFYYDKNIDGTSVTVTYKDTELGSYTGALTIPETVTDGEVEYQVNAIGESAFSKCYDLTEVVVPSSVMTIGAEAFAYCNSLSQVSISSTVYSIGHRAFMKCIGLRIFKINAPNPATISLGEDVFASSPLGMCTLLVPEESKTLYDMAPWNSFGSIEESDFDFCKDNAEGTRIYYDINPDGTSVTVSWRDNFYNSYSGTVNVPANVSYGGIDYVVSAIGENAFYECKGLTSVTLPEGLTEIGETAFAYCKNLSEIELPNTLSTIGCGAFNSCTSLTALELPEGLTKIEDTAFAHCKGLKGIEFPATLTNLGSYSFQYCTSLATVKVKVADPAEIAMGYNVFYYTEVKNCTLYVPEGSEEAYSHAPQWEDFGVFEGFDNSGMHDLQTEGVGEGEEWHDLLGRRVKSPVRGIFIRNGQKVIMR